VPRKLLFPSCKTVRDVISPRSSVVCLNCIYMYVCVCVCVCVYVYIYMQPYIHYNKRLLASGETVRDVISPRSRFVRLNYISILTLNPKPKSKSELPLMTITLNAKP
jgi:hypothetical protein